MAYKNDENKNFTANFLRFEENEEKVLVLNEWTFGRGPGGYLFKTYVEEENGEKVDKIWTVWDYESAQRLKKVIGVKTSEKKKIKAKMMLNDEIEQSFEIEAV